MLHFGYKYPSPLSFEKRNTCWVACFYMCVFCKKSEPYTCIFCQWSIFLFSSMKPIPNLFFFSFAMVSRITSTFFFYWHFSSIREANFRFYSSSYMLELVISKIIIGMVGNKLLWRVWKMGNIYCVGLRLNLWYSLIVTDDLYTGWLSSLRT